MKQAESDDEKFEAEWWEYRKHCNQNCPKCKYEKRCASYDLEAVFGEGGL